MLVPLELPPGVITYDSDRQARNRWISSSNIRFRDKRPETLGGWTKMFASPLSGVPRKMLAFNRSGTATMAYGTTTKLYVGTGIAQPTDRSPVGLPSGIEAWSLDAWGSTLLASPQDGTLYEQSGSGTATEVTQAPDRITAMLVSPERRQVLAFGCNEEGSGTFNGLCVRWCDFEDYTDWTTSPSNNAGEHILTGAGRIVTARWVGANIWIWTDNTLWECSFLGNPGQTYYFRAIDDNSGLVGPNAVDVVDGRAFWIRPDLSLMTAAPGFPPQALNTDNQFSTGNATSAGKMLLGTNQRFNEVWMFAPSTVGGENGSGKIYNYKDNVSSNLAFGRTAALDDGVLRTVLGGSYQSTFIAADSDGTVYVHETGTTADGEDMAWSLASGFVSFNDQRRVMIRRIIPNIINAFPVTVQIEAYEYPLSDAVTKSVSVVVPKKDTRVSGKFFTFSLTGSLYCRIAELTLDIVPMGER